MKRIYAIIISILFCVLFCGCSLISPAKYALKENLEDFENSLKSSVNDQTDVLTKAVAENFSFDVGKQTENEETGVVTVKVEITTVDIEDLETRAEKTCGENQQKKNDVLRQENEQLRADLDYISAMIDVPLEVGE